MGPVVRNRQFVFALVAMLATISIMSLTARERQRLTLLEERFMEALAPLQSLIEQAAASVAGSWLALGELRTARLDNLSLKAELEKLSDIHTRLREIEAENARLRELLEFKQASPHALMPARVIGHNPDSWFNYLIIDKGASDGVTKDMPVVTPKGLVGRVAQVTPGTARVMLLSDADSGVGGLVQRSRDAGVVLGGVGRQQFLTVRLFSRDADIVPGDQIVSSGLGGIFPRGLPIGVVVRVDREEYGLLKTASIRAAVDFGRLEEVFVLGRGDGP